MALPQKAIDEFGRESRITPGWSGKLLMFTSLIFIISAVVYIGLMFGYVPYLQSQVGETQKKIEEFRSKISPAREAELVTFYSQLVNIDNLLKSQEYASSILSWFETHTNRDVFYSLLAADIEKRQVLVRGRARNPQSLVLQIKEYEEATDLENVEFTGTSLDAQGYWTVDLTLIFKREFFMSALPLDYRQTVSGLPLSLPSSSTSSSAGGI